MKRTVFITVMLAMVLSASAQQRSVILPGNAKIDVEKLNKQIPLNMDVSKLSISEARVLRNAFAARQGYCFMSGDLRSIFEATSWYGEKMNDRFWEEEDGKAKPLTYTDAEKAFMQKLKDREEALKQQNFVAPNGMMVNMDNLINPFQLASFDPKLRQALAKNAFAIVPGDEQQLFHVYERNDYHQFPNFVTTDLFLQVFHMYFDCLLKEVEQEKFVPLLTSFVKQLYDAMSTQASFATDPNVKTAAQYNAAFFAIAHALLTGENNLPVAPNYTALVKEEINHVNNAEIYEQIHNYVSLIAPDRGDIVSIYSDDQPIFDKFNVTRQMKSSFGKTVSFRSGAYIIIESTEALHVIDVNSGNRSRKTTDQESNALDVNLLAADEIARQLRLRDMGGIIVIDFIDMAKGEHRQALYDHMKEVMQKDRARHNILPLSKFGLMQITRQRVRPALDIVTSETCPSCGGKGEVMPSLLFTDRLKDKIHYLVNDLGVKGFIMYVHPFVDAYLKKGFISLYMKWRREFGRVFKIMPDQDLAYLQYRVIDKNKQEIDLSEEKDTSSSSSKKENRQRKQIEQDDDNQ